MWLASVSLSAVSWHVSRKSRSVQLLFSGVARFCQGSCATVSPSILSVVSRLFVKQNGVRDMSKTGGGNWSSHYKPVLSNTRSENVSLFPPSGVSQAAATPFQCDQQHSNGQVGAGCSSLLRSRPVVDHSVSSCGWTDRSVRGLLLSSGNFVRRPWSTCATRSNPVFRNLIVRDQTLPRITASNSRGVHRQKRRTLCAGRVGQRITAVQSHESQ